MKQTCILILGMHRSGTSALTGLLSKLDVFLGSELMQANFANEKGYFENNILNYINENFLMHMDSSWDDLFYSQSKLDRVANDFTILKSGITSEFEYANVFAIKDPRVIYLFPLYEKVLNELDIDIKIIIPYRNPFEVASSLKKRDGISFEKGLLLWAYNFLLAENFSRGYKRVFIGFDDLLSNTEKVVDEISSKLGMDLNHKYRENKKDIDKFIDLGLKHHSVLSIDNISEKLPKIVRDIMEMKDEFNNVDSLAKFDLLRNKMISYHKLFYNSSIEKSLKEGQENKRELQRKNARLRERDQEISQKNQELSQKDQELSQKDQEISQKDQEISQKNQELSQKDQEISQKDYKVNEYYKQISQLQTELTSIYRSTSWKITRPIRIVKKVIRKVKRLLMK